MPNREAPIQLFTNIFETIQLARPIRGDQIMVLVQRAVGESYYQSGTTPGDNEDGPPWIIGRSERSPNYDLIITVEEPSNPLLHPTRVYRKLFVVGAELPGLKEGGRDKDFANRMLKEFAKQLQTQVNDL